MAQVRRAKQGWKLTRDQMDALLYGGRRNPRFTQDSPVLPDVWIRYAEAPDEPHELLLPRSRTRRGTVRRGTDRVLKACLALREGRTSRQPRPTKRRPSVAYNQSTVLARLWLTSSCVWCCRCRLVASARRAEPAHGRQPRWHPTSRQRAAAARTSCCRRCVSPKAAASRGGARPPGGARRPSFRPTSSDGESSAASTGVERAPRQDATPPLVAGGEESVEKMDARQRKLYDKRLDQHYREVVKSLIALTKGSRCTLGE